METVRGYCSQSRFFFVALKNGACSSDTIGRNINVSDVWIRAASMTDMAPESGMYEEIQEEAGFMSLNTAGYMLVENKGDQPDTLLRVESGISQAGEMHVSDMVGDVMKMSQVEFIQMPACSQVELKPESYHIMFIVLKNTIEAGDKVEFTLVFEKFGELSILAEVRSP